MMVTLTELLSLNEGLLKVPPALVQKIKEISLFKLADHNLSNISDQISNYENFIKNKPDNTSVPIIKNIIKHGLDLKKQLLKLHIAKADNYYDNPVVINISGSMLHDWEYRKRFRIKYILNKNINLILMFEFQKSINDIKTLSGTSNNYSGLYQKVNPVNNFAKIVIIIPYIDITIHQNINNAINQINEIIVHEVGHLVQELILIAKKNKYIENDNKYENMFGGIPSKRLTSQNKEERLNKSDTPHSLMDVEFYTNLGGQLLTEQAWELANNSF